MQVSVMTGLIMVVPKIQAETVPLPTEGHTTLIKLWGMGGTIEEVDQAGLKITIQTEMGKKESFPVSSAEVIRGLAKGDQVSVELDEQGKVLNVVRS